MKNCPNCGAAVTDNAGFCPNCGAELPRPAENPAAPQASAGFCGACGERLQEGVAFCPNCGAPVKAGKPGKKSAGATHKYKIIGISAVTAAVVVLVVLAVTLLPGISRSDAEDFVYYQQKLLVDPMMNTAASGVNGVLGMLNTDLTITAQVDDPGVGRLLNNASVVLKVKAEKGRIVLNADANLMGSQLLTASGYFEDGVLGFYLPQARDVLYTMDVSQYLDLPDDWLSAIDAGELTQCVQKYLDIAFSTVNDGNLKVEKNKTVPYAALMGQFKGTLYTFAPTAGDIQDLLERLADALEGDQYLAGLLDTARCEEWTLYGWDGKELLAQAANELRDEAREAGRTVEDTGFQWTLAMEGKKVRQILITADGMTVGYESSGDEKDKDGRRFCVFTLRGGSRVNKILSGGTFRDGKELSGRVELDTGDGIVDFNFSCQPDERSPLEIPCGSFEISGEGMSFTFRVQDAGDGSFDHTFSTEGLSVNINATKKSTAAMPDAPVEDISNYSYQELDDLFYDLGYAIGQDLGLEFGIDAWDILNAIDRYSGYVF